MTDEMMSLRALVEKAPDADVLREMIGFAAELCRNIAAGLGTEYFPNLALRSTFKVRF